MFYLFRNYKDYGKYIKDWTIEPVKDANATAYWQRIFGKLESSLAEEANHRLPTYSLYLVSSSGSQI